MTFRNCAETGCGLNAAIVEDVVVDGLKTSDLLQTWAVVFKHVTLKGKIDRLMFSDFLHPGFPRLQELIAPANSNYYARVDWALDIKEAELKELDCRGVPARLVRRDPETQIMVTRERVLASRDDIAVGGEYWHDLLKLFLESSYADHVLIAPRRDPQFKEFVAGLHRLRQAGVAEPD